MLSRDRRFAVLRFSDAYVLNPWGDTSLAIPLSREVDKIVEVLNNVHLPKRFTAIWHMDTQDLEIIYTAFPLSAGSQVLTDRSFTFRHEEEDYVCEYGASSERLLTIAEFATPVSESTTEYRNLQSFYFYSSARKTSKERSNSPTHLPKLGIPISFWVRKIRWNEQDVLSLIRHLNFYMTYYDRKSPVIMVHTPAVESASVEPELSRYRLGKFPKHIKSRQTEENLLHFWNAAREGDPTQRFLFNFRIVEYVSYSFLEDDLWITVQRALASPHALDDLQKTTEDVVSAMQATKLDATQRFDAVVRKFVSTKVLWEHLAKDKATFAAETVFESGLTVAPLITTGMKQKDCAIFILDKVSKDLRDIRNALAHGKDLKTAQVITPTPGNFTKLQPWAGIMATIASEVMINRTVG